MLVKTPRAATTFISLPRELRYSILMNLDSLLSKYDEHNSK
jgi:hypothetical protein